MPLAFLIDLPWEPSLLGQIGMGVRGPCSNHISHGISEAKFDQPQPSWLSLCHLTLVVVHAGDSVSRQIDHIDILTNNRKTPDLAPRHTRVFSAGISDKTTPSADSSRHLAMFNGSDVVLFHGVSQGKFKQRVLQVAQLLNLYSTDY